MSPDALHGTQPAVEPKLDSWKQIAGYLERDVRTAQRWEKSEGLPVHRHQHGSRGTVFAYRSEIDAWLESRTRAGGQEAASDLAPAAVEEPTPISASGPAPSRRLVLVACALVTALAGAFWLFGGPAARDALGSSEARLLILPLTSIAGDPLEETTGRALHEDLITELARLAPKRLSVLGRTSSLRYAAADRGLAEIGAELDLDFVLEGSVWLREESLHVTTRLVRAFEESEVWSESFVLEGRDLGQGDASVSRAVCSAVAKELLHIKPPSPRGSSATSPARDAWQRGRYLSHKGTVSGFRSSLPHFEEALRLEPEFLEAHAALANAYVLLGRYGNQPPGDVFPKAKASALYALELDPLCAEAHAALAAVHFYFEWDFEAAAQAFRTALLLGPELALTHHTYAHFLSCLGLHEEGLEAVRTARALEPLWPLVVADTAWFHYRARDYVRAAAESRRALELEPGMNSAVQCLVSSLQQLGEDRAAWSEMRTYLDGQSLLAVIPGLEGEDPAHALHNVRRWNRAEVERHAKENFVSPRSHVFTLTGLGRAEEILDWLEVSLTTRDRVALLTRVHPAFDDLRENPRFQSVVERVGFPTDPAQLTGGPPH